MFSLSLSLSLLSLCAVSFRPTSRRRVRDHVNNDCLRDILMRSGSRHLLDTCTWLIVAHRHARTSSPSAERLNLCLSGKKSCFTCPCFQSPVHGSAAELRTTALVCFGIVSRRQRRENDWSNWNRHCSRLRPHRIATLETVAGATTELLSLATTLTEIKSSETEALDYR